MRARSREKAVKKEEINTCIETNGSSPRLPEISEYIDHLIMDFTGLKKMKTAISLRIQILINVIILNAVLPLKKMARYILTTGIQFIYQTTTVFP